MGLSVVISGAIIMVTLMMVLYSIPGLMDSIVSVEETSSELSILENTILQTSISIDSITATSNSDTVTFNLNNIGSEKLWNYDEFELFITYDADVSGTLERVTETIKHAPPDFNVQRACTAIPVGSTSLTISPGSDYTSPIGEAFVRIVDTRLSGNGNTNGGGTNRPVDDITAYISDATDLTNQIVFTRTGSTEDTRICWEIIDYVGPSDGKNAIKVLDRNTVTYATTVLTATPAATPVPAVDDNDVVVFITGQAGDDTAAGGGDLNNAMSTAEWLGGTDQPRFTRGQADGSEDTSDLSYAVVEFTGSDWIIQRVEHDYGGTGLETATAPADFNALNALNKAVLHTQHRSGNGLSGLDEQGEEAWISATNTISFQLEAGATGPFPGSYFTVAWIIENIGTTGSPMNVQHFSGTTNVGDCAPACTGIEDIYIENIPTPINDIASASIMGENAKSTGGGNSYPRGALSLELISNTQVELRRSDHSSPAPFGQNQDYRFSVVEWPSGKNVVAPQWGIDSLLSDFLDPGILNEDESALVSVLLSNPVFANGNVVIVISTDQGVSTSGSVIAT